MEGEKNTNLNSRVRIGKIRTMAKDIARIRLLQTKTQREKIIGLGAPQQQSKPRQQPQSLPLQKPQLPKQPPQPQPQEKIVEKKPSFAGAETQNRLEQAQKRIETLKQTIKKQPSKQVFFRPDFVKPLIPEQKLGKEPRLEPSKVFKPAIEKPSEKQKYLIRILTLAIILVIVSGAFTLVYWYLTQKQELPTPSPAPIVEEQPKEPEQPEEPEPEEPEKEPVKPEPIISSSLILVDNSKTLEVDKMEQVPNVLAGTLKQELEQKQLIRIVIKNTAELQFIELKEFFEIFQIESPENLLENLEKGFTLFMYKPEQENRLGFVAKIKDKEQFSVIAKSWESTMEQDFENLFLILDKTQKAQTSFKQAKYKQVIFNYISFPGKDFGICWTIINDYFTFTSSGKTMIKVIDVLQDQ